jgi:hypothetical protein
MTTVTTPPRSDSDSASFRGYPSTGSQPAQQAAVDAPGRVESFVNGTVQAADANPAPISNVVHQPGCPDCAAQAGDQWSHVDARTAPGQDQVVGSQLIRGPNSA